MANTERNKETALMFQELRNDYKGSLNPSEYPGTLSLIFELDSKVLLMTTDNELYIGELNSFDAFGSVVISKTHYPSSEKNLGVCYFRSEQIAFIGHIDKEKEEQQFPNLLESQ